MLVPAIVYKDELEKLFAEEIYTKRYFYYSGYPFDNTLPETKPVENHFQWAIVTVREFKEEIIGYFAYRIDPLTNNVYNFGLYSFDDGNIMVIKEVYEKLEELLKKHHKIEWRVIEGNHAKNGYDEFCKRHNGNIIHLHDVTKDPDGNYVDEWLYEVFGGK